MKILALAASSSSKSINKQLLGCAADYLNEHEVELIDINDYEMPLYSSDREESGGVPQLAHDFYNKISGADALLISYAEHNGSYTAAYKNLFDWASRVNMKVFQDKSAIYLATSLGPGGASSVLASAIASAHFFGAHVKANFSLPSFYENFDLEGGYISNTELRNEFESALDKIVEK